jgi:membrane-associated protease RseP (regulator of RpoE activity)
MKKNVFTLALLFCVFILNAQHSRPVLGITTSTVTYEKVEAWDLENKDGFLVRKVYPNSPAKAAGLQPFDFITAINGKQLDDEAHFSSFLNEYQVGEIVNVTYTRNGQSRSVSLPLANGNEDMGNLHRSSEQDPFLGISASHRNMPEGVKGVAVSVIHNSTAQAMGLESNDIITQIDDFKVLDWHDMDPAIDNRNVGDPIKVTFYRDGEMMSRTRVIKSRAATHNDHSRPNGPSVIEPETPSTEVSEAIIEDALEKEILALELDLAEAASEDNQTRSQPTADTNQKNILTPNTLKFQELNVFPNPSTGIFDLEFDLPDEGRTAVRIYNPNGQAIYFNNLGNFSGRFSDRIDIANSMKGTYFLELSQDDKRLVQKLILQ